MEIVKVISEWGKRPTFSQMQKFGFIGPHQKMVQAIVRTKQGMVVTRHIPVQK